jgi:3D-(3,5/4)-trihydroxycyclohexane-1,2-dione acylhydrolase (decyclizing)
MTTVRLTVAQALVRFLTAQFTERDGTRHRLVAGVSGIFGHGNVAGVGEALADLERREPGLLPYRQARNEQAMVHTAVGFAWRSNRMSTLACTTSVGPGATNLVTGAALATINRLPVLLLPGDVFATRRSGVVLQGLDTNPGGDVSVNDCLRPVSRYFDRVGRPEMLPDAMLAAMRTLTDPADTGAVTLALPQDVQAEAADWTESLFAQRIWRIPRSPGDPESVAGLAQSIAASRRPLIVAGGGVKYSAATAELAAFAAATGIPVAETQAGKGSIAHDDALAVGAVGATGSSAANDLAARADLVIGIGTRWSDFTTASRSLVADPNARLATVNVSPADAGRNGWQSLVADARAGLAAVRSAVGDWQVPDDYRQEAISLADGWRAAVDAALAPTEDGSLTQHAVIGVVGRECGDATVICAAGSMPGDLHRLWKATDTFSYHVEYGYSCMGYEIAGGLGVALADPDRRVVVMVGDASFLMLAQELTTAVAEKVAMTVVVVDNSGYASIGSLSRSVGSGGYGTAFRYRSPDGTIAGENLPVDLAAVARGLGAAVREPTDLADLAAALGDPPADGPVVVVVRTVPGGPPPGGAFWDVPVAQISESADTVAAFQRFEKDRAAQRLWV